ncbi:MAG: hypothetical protein M1817_001485 [Caeruleum heppii]|nr:MAG: hypothetical protein M1817_001485 [Caeruleum heppii]
MILVCRKKDDVFVSYKSREGDDSDDAGKDQVTASKAAKVKANRGGRKTTGKLAAANSHQTGSEASESKASESEAEETDEDQAETTSKSKTSVFKKAKQPKPKKPPTTLAKQNAIKNNPAGVRLINDGLDNSGAEMPGYMFLSTTVELRAFIFDSDLANGTLKRWAHARLAGFGQPGKKGSATWTRRPMLR